MNPQQRPQRPAPTQVLEEPIPEQGKLLDTVLQQTCDRLDAIAGRYVTALQDTLTPLHRAMLLADGLDRLRGALTPQIMKRVMSLMNSPLGFLTDKNPTKGDTAYPEGVVKECVIEALLKGFFWTGNEFNIIAGKFYGAQAGYARKVRELPGLTDLKLSPGVPVLHNGRTVVRYAASWKLNGTQRRFIDGDGKPGRPFAVIARDRDSADAIIGKATRKALKAIYDEVVGSEHSLEPDEPIDRELEAGEINEDKPASAGPPVGRVNLRQPRPAPEPAPAPAAEPPQRQPGEDDWPGDQDVRNEHGE